MKSNFNNLFLNTFEQLKKSFHQMSLALFHPLRFAKTLDTTDLKSSLVYFLALACLSGFLFGVCTGEWTSILVGLFIYPILCWVVGSALLMSLYYFFYFTEQRTYDWKSLLSYFAQVSFLFFFFHPISGLVSRYSMALSGLVDLLAFAFASLIFAYVLVERLKTPKRKTAQLFIGLIALISVVWLVRNVTRWLDRSEDAGYRHSRLNQLERRN